jgi:indole-3-glycerol phosphate synthase
VTGQATPDLLATIVAATRHIVSAREAEVPRKALERTIARTPDGSGFRHALRDAPAPRVIAECKRRSPSKGILRQDYDPASHARAYQDAGAVAISVLTEPTFFDGDPAHLRAVRDAVTIPILRKDFIVSEYQLYEAVAIGADAVLLIVGALQDEELRGLHRKAESLGLACLVEVHDGAELTRAVDAGATIVGVNSRNLRTLSVDLNVLDSVARLLPPAATAVAESGIRTRADIERLTAAGYRAFLVGERLIAHDDPGAALRQLNGR